jgi:hypothetical protein
MTNKQKVANALHSAWSALYEAHQLRHAAQHIKEHDCDDAEAIVDILETDATQREDIALEAIQFAQQHHSKPQQKKPAKKKLAVVKADKSA